jgi:hypothetical protein
LHVHERDLRSDRLKRRPIASDVFKHLAAEGSTEVTKEDEEKWSRQRELRDRGRDRY